MVELPAAYVSHMKVASMPNNRAKGRRKERKVRDHLIQAGYTVQMAPTPTRWATQTDIVGLWDLVAFGPEDIVCVQVKSSDCLTKEWKERARAWVCPKNCRKEVWILEDRKPIKIIVF